jgi:hypothetical protein
MKWIVSLLFIVGFVFSTYAQKGYALVRVIDCAKNMAVGNTYMSPQILITFDNGDSEKIDLQPYSEKAEPENLKLIVEVLNRMRKRGFTLITSTMAGEQGNYTYEYVFLNP